MHQNIKWICIKVCWLKNLSSTLAVLVPQFVGFRVEILVVTVWIFESNWIGQNYLNSQIFSNICTAPILNNNWNFKNDTLLTLCITRKRVDQYLPLNFTISADIRSNSLCHYCWSCLKPWPNCAPLCQPHPFDALLCSTWLHFCSRPETTSDVISGRFFGWMCLICVRNCVTLA